MTILQRYVVKELIGPLLMGLAVFTFVFLVGQLFKLTKLLLSSGVSPLLAGELIVSLLPGILSITIPMAILVAILLAVGRLAADREILAIRTSGVNLFHICTPLIITAAILSALLIWANQNLVPYLNLKSSDLGTQLFFNTLVAIPEDRPNPLESAGEGASAVFFFDERDTVTQEMIGVNVRTVMEPEESPKQQQIERKRKKKISELQKKNDPESLKEMEQLVARQEQVEQERKQNESIITAQRGRIKADMEERLVLLELTSGSMHLVNPEQPATYNVVHFEKFERAIRPDYRQTETGAYKKEPREMGVAELKNFMNTARRPGPFIVEHLQRFSIPFACLAFTLIAIPLAVIVRPRGKAIAFALSFFLILLYYGLLNYGTSMGDSGSSMAPFAIFFPNLLLGSIGTFLLYRMVMK